ncbi:Virginiamycin A acetyltransferase [compost metagenome]
MHGPDPANPHPMKGFPQLCFIKNTIKGPNIEVGDYSYYDDTIARLNALAWWDWPVEQISRHLPLISGGEIAALEAASR